MDSENLQRVWEIIAEKAARENNPQKHMELVKELLSLMSKLNAAREKGEQDEKPK
jgi:hypothetical protein